MSVAQDPYRSFNFLVEIDAVTVAAFSEVTGLTAETEVIEYRTGGMLGGVHKLAGLTKYANITLKRGMTQNLELWNWYKNVVEGKTDRRSASIVLLNEAHQEALRWNVVNAWPRKWDGPALNARHNEIAIETLELAHEGLELVAA
jgi:phage tail-like protein